MIMSLGGSPEPLKKSIAAHQPEMIIFLASQDSLLNAGEVLKALESKPEKEFEIVEDPNSILECYQKARACVARAKKYESDPASITVDYTGGTKVMTAALILATIGQPFHFNYVGGEKRNKNGLGTVMDGHEVMFAEMNPWSVFAEEERQQVVTLFNRRRYSAVEEIIKGALERELPREIREYFKVVRIVASAFLAWEQFNHAGAASSLDKGLKTLREYLRTYYQEPLWDFAERIATVKEILDRIIRDTDSLKKLHPVLVDDLLNNARRRMMDSRYDDAAARIYRALELYGQIEFEKLTGIPNSNVPQKILPESLATEFICRYLDKQNGVLRLSQEATFRFLQAAGNDAGKRYFQNIQEIRKIQNSRNFSILAHGINPVSKHAADSIFTTVSQFVQFQANYDFPQLPG